jgi:hypothetical protein
MDPKEKLLDSQLPDEIDIDDLDPEIHALLYPDSDDGEDKPKREKAKPAPTTGQYRSRDGKSFDSIEAYEAHVAKRDESADIKFRTAAKINRTQTREDAPKIPQKIDLKTIDPDDSEKLRDAIANNESVAEQTRKQEFESLQGRFDSAEQAAAYQASRKELRATVRAEATKRGLKINAEVIDEFLDEAEKAESPVEQATALMKLLETAQKSATDDPDDGKTKTREPSGSIRVPGGGQGGLRKQDVIERAQKKMDELMASGRFSELSVEEQMNLGRACVGERPIYRK